MFGRRDEDDQMETSLQEDETIPSAHAVRSGPANEFIHFSRIAEPLDAVPWDVLRVCRQLVRIGIAQEGKGKQRRSFRRI
jgi:hypothetical protein